MDLAYRRRSLSRCGSDRRHLSRPPIHHSLHTHARKLAQSGGNRIGILSRQCLGTRRIPDLARLRREVQAWNRRMNRARTKINWKFDRRAARRKFGHKRKSFKRS
jgi:hypothetical protein